MSIEGRIHIRLDPGSESPVAISSSRPRQLMQQLRGLDPVALQDRIPLLYALCGQAQQLAATQALRGACARPSDAVERSVTEQQRAVVIEALQEYLWRFLIDLPQRLHQPAATAVFAPLFKILRQLVDAPLAGDETMALLARLDDGIRIELLGMSAQNWLALDIDGWDRWLEQSPVALAAGLRQLRQRLQSLPAIAPAQCLLPDPPSPDLLAQLGDLLAYDAEFAFAPYWQRSQRQQPETGPLSYQQHQPWLVELERRQESVVLRRMLARLFELLRLRLWLQPRDEALVATETAGFLLTDTMALKDSMALNDTMPLSDSMVLSGSVALSGSVKLSDQAGLGWVRTARGLLVHRLQLDQGIVSDYCILAPTEWNFHPQGPLNQGLQRWLAATVSQLPDWVGLQVLSLDPCVDYQFEVKHA